MPRPYLSCSIAELEAEFDRAQDNGDKQALDRLVHELSFRTTPRARELRQAVEHFLGDKRKPNEKRSSASDAEQPRTTPRGERHRASDNHGARPTPTDEQREAIEQFRKGGSLKINAYAGTGKTSTLELLAQSTIRRGQYIAFNRDIVRDAGERFPSTVNCSTTHGLAFKATPSKYKNNSDKMTARISANQLAEILKLKQWQIDKLHSLQPRSQGYLILETLRRFMHSADAEPGAEHVPRHGSLITASESTLKAVTEFALHGAKHVWDRMRDESDPIPLGHDGYLKLWVQSDPVIAADFILLDEAQDTNPVILDLLRNQPAQMIYVGDKYQQIYEWRGAINAMERIATDGMTYLTTSFRFGPAIAEFASRLLALLNEKRPIKGNANIGRPKTL